MRHEMATTLVDVLDAPHPGAPARPGATVEAAPAVAELLAAELGWDDAETERQIDDYSELVGPGAGRRPMSGVSELIRRLQSS